MKRFECEVTMTGNYVVEIDDEELGEEFLSNFKKHFYSYDDWSEHAGHLATRIFLGDDFVEGYGAPLVNNEPPLLFARSDIEPAINIIKQGGEYNTDVDVKEL